MKKILFGLVAGAFLFASCDKVENPYPVDEQGDYSLFPGGDSATYWATDGPVFGPNTNTTRNVLIEDFTGHRCNNCPKAADTAEALHDAYPSRVYVATVHSGPLGIGTFQQVLMPDYPTDWTNPDGLDLGMHIFNLPNSGFIGNPSGMVNRVRANGGTGDIALAEGTWSNAVSSQLPQTLKVNIQSAANYYASTRGTFLHTEIEVLDPAGVNEDSLYTVVYLIEDSLVGAQLMPDNSLNPTYVHKEIMRDCILSGHEGIEITDEYEVDDDVYRFDYIFELPAQYDATNMHMLIFVRDAVTEEVYHVIKQKFID